MSRGKNRVDKDEGCAAVPPLSFKTYANLQTAKDLESRILFRNSHIIILNKPAGLAVHSGPSTPESLEIYLPSLCFGLTILPVAAHRLDRDTSGCLVLARNARARSRLGRLFEAGAIQKTYWGIVEGVPSPLAGEIKLGLTKRSSKNGWRMVPDAAGLEAETRYRVVYSDKKRSLLELHLMTGRTHQIRVHCAALGHPIVGDPVYGHPTIGTPQLLHAKQIVIPYREGAPAIEATAPIPLRFRSALSQEAFSGEAW